MQRLFSSPITRGAWLVVSWFGISTGYAEPQQEDGAACRNLGQVLQNPKLLNQWKGPLYDKSGLSPEYFSKRGFWTFESCKIQVGLGGLGFSCTKPLSNMAEQQRVSMFDSEKKRLQMCMGRLGWKELDQEQCVNQPHCVEFVDTTDPAEEKNTATLDLVEDIPIDATNTAARYQLMFNVTTAPSYQGKRR